MYKVVRTLGRQGVTGGDTAFSEYPFHPKGSGRGLCHGSSLHEFLTGPLLPGESIDKVIGGLEDDKD